MIRLGSLPILVSFLACTTTASAPEHPERPEHSEASSPSDGAEKLARSDHPRDVAVAALLVGADDARAHAFLERAIDGAPDDPVPLALAAMHCQRESVASACRDAGWFGAYAARDRDNAHPWIVKLNEAVLRKDEAAVEIALTEASEKHHHRRHVGELIDAIQNALARAQPPGVDPDPAVLFVEAMGIYASGAPSFLPLMQVCGASPRAEGEAVVVADPAERCLRLARLLSESDEVVSVQVGMSLLRRFADQGVDGAPNPEEIAARMETVRQTVDAFTAEGGDWLDERSDRVTWYLSRLAEVGELEAMREVNARVSEKRDEPSSW